MDIIRLGFSVALVLLNLLQVAPHQIGAFGSPVNSPSVQKAETLENLLWVNCRLEMICSKEVCKDLDLSTFGTLDTNALDDVLMSALQQQISPELLNCMRENVFISPISGDDCSSSKRYMKLLESLASKLPSEMRRYLAGVSAIPSLEFVQAPGTAPSPTSFEKPSPELVQAPRTAPSPASEKPSPELVQAPRTAPSPTSYAYVVSGNPDTELNKDNSNHKTVVIAVVVTAVVTFTFAFLFFLCCRKLCRKHYSNAYKDERPLLSISMSDYSGSPKSDVFHSSSQVMGYQFYGSNTVEGKQVGSLEGNLDSADRVDKLSMQPSTLNSNGPPLPLKPPPGRVPPPGLPPLKPPPGKAKPLPPEPPASLRPPNKDNPPLPPPATPPPPPTATPPPPPPATPPPPPPAPPAPPRKAPSAGVGPPLGSAPPPPPAPSIKTAVRPPPPLKSGAQPPRPPSLGMKDHVDASRTKLKPFFWDKVLADPDHSMVWHQIKSGSFQFNEEMIESLFGYVPPDRNKPTQQKDSSDSASQFIQLIDSNKAKNLSILLRALNVTTEEVCDALEQGNELPPEFLETLLKMAPTTEEELKLRLFGGELSQLGPAERFLKVLVDIPFAFKRMDVLLFMCTFEEEVASIRESFTVLEAACNELTNSRLFLKLLEAVLKTGNRMNDGTFRGGAQAFKLDTLLKLSDVKGVDGKTTLLHFVVQQIILSEGIRVARAGKSESFSSVKSDDLKDMEEESEEQLCCLGLQEVSSLAEQLENVKKAGGVDGDNLTGSIAKLRATFIKTRNFLNSEMKNVGEGNGFHQVLKCFVDEVNTTITSLSEEETRITDLMKSTADYFHGTAGKEEGLRLFAIVRDFLIMLNRVCAEVRDNNNKSKRNNRNQKRDLQFL